MAAIFFLIFVDFLWIDLGKIYREKKKKSNFGNLLARAYSNPWLEEVLGNSSAPNQIFNAILLLAFSAAA